MTHTTPIEASSEKDLKRRWALCYKKQHAEVVNLINDQRCSSAHSSGLVRAAVHMPQKLPNSQQGVRLERAYNIKTLGIINLWFMRQNAMFLKLVLFSD